MDKINMDKIFCAIIAVILIAYGIVLDVCIIASYSPTMLLKMGERIVFCILWSILFGWGAYMVWDSRAK